MGNFCSGKQAKKEAKLEDMDKPGERGDEAAAGATVRDDGVQAEVKDTSVGSEPVEEGKVKADDGMRVVKDLAKELAKEAEAKALARKHAAEKASIKAEEDARKSLQQAEETAAEVAEGTKEAAEGSKQDAGEKLQVVMEGMTNTAGEKVQTVVEETRKTAEDNEQTAEVAISAKQEAEEKVDAAMQQMEQDAAAEAAAAKETTQDFVDSTILATQAASAEEQSRVAEDIQAVCETASVPAQAVCQTASDAETQETIQTLENKVTEVVKEKIVAEAEETKQTSETAPSAVNDEVIKCVQAVLSEAEAAISQAEEKAEKFQPAAVQTVESIESQAFEAVASGEDQTAATAQCAENLASESQKQTEKVATCVAETAEDSGAASKEYIVATAIQSSAEVEQAAREALQTVGQKLEETKDCLIEKAQEDMLEKGQQIPQEVEDSLSALGQKIENAGQSVPETAAETMALTQEVSQKATDDLNKVADRAQTGAEAAAEEGDQAASQQHQEASGLESLSEEQLKRPSSGAEAEPAPGIAKADSVLVQDSMHAGLQSVVQKGGELRCTNIDKMLEAVGGADGAAGEGGLDTSQNNATSFHPLSPGAAQEVQGDQGLSGIILDLFSLGPEGDVLVGQGHSQVERKEEELPPTMRETCVHQTSMQEGEISPSDEVSYGDEGLLPPPPADFDEEAGLDDLPSPQSSESVPDEETLQRVAAQVTNQAVQEAIRMFTENGLGGITPTSDISSPPSEPLSSPAPTNNLIDFNDAESSPLDLMSICPPIVPSLPSPTESFPTAEPISPQDDAESVAVTDVPELPPSSGVVNSGLPMDSIGGSSEALI